MATSGAGVRIEDEGSSVVAASRAVNFVGAGVAVTDGGGGEATVTISGGGAGGHTVRENGTDLTARTGLNFTSGLVATDDAVGDESEVAVDTATVMVLTGNQTVAGVKTFSSDPIIPDEAYDATAWNGSLEPATKNAIRDKFESLPEVLGVAVTDESTVITTGTAKVTFRMPYAMTVTATRANLVTASTSGVVTVDINDGGITILSTKLTVDANEKTSTTAAAAPVISDSALADDAEITVDIDTAGTGAKGLKIWLIGTRT